MLTQIAEKLASLSIYVDKLHIKGHTDPWCLENCDPRKVDDLEGVCSYADRHILFYIYICNVCTFLAIEIDSATYK